VTVVRAEARHGAMCEPPALRELRRKQGKEGARGSRG
jgi:hypothetical protein